METVHLDMEIQEVANLLQMARPEELDTPREDLAVVAALSQAVVAVVAGVTLEETRVSVEPHTQFQDRI